MKNKIGESKKTIGRFIYADWIIPFSDYFEANDKKELMFDILCPIIVAIVVTIISNKIGIVTLAISKLCEILPNILAILIGFSISAMAIVTANPEKGAYNKNCGDKIVDKKPLTVYRYILIAMVVTVCLEIFSLVFVFVVCFIRAIVENNYLDYAILFFYVFLVLSILAILVRAVLYIYSANFKM
ncbi:hypothetical protein SAMN04515656_104134 [Eubacterium aggregans]|uniref:Uncharacterized protein n=1 Tax=Eubacterium aggregans TaxID=81409 RepID=A0A1H3YVN7_9FIRM|nr:hypothetical protein SAMN04515656_104134 [Eubacterium aggregans]